MINESKIVKGCCKYSKKSQKALYELYAPKMSAICLRYAPDASTAKDILQEGFIKVFSNIKKYEGKGSLEGWIKRIMINTAINYLNSEIKKNRNVEYNDEISGNYESEDKILENEKIERADIDENNINTELVYKADFSKEELLEALNILPEEFKIVFTFFYLEKLKHKEIAQVLKIDEGTSRTRLLRAKNILKKHLYEKCLDKVTI